MQVMGEEKAAQTRADMEAHAKRSAIDSRVADELALGTDISNFPTNVWAIAQYLGVRTRVPNAALLATA
jgi:hypothetical protein